MSISGTHIYSTQMREDANGLRNKRIYLADRVHPQIIIPNPNRTDQALTTGIELSSARQTVRKTIKVRYTYLHAWMIGDIQPKPPSTSPPLMDTALAPLNEVNHSAALPSISYNHRNGL